MAKGRSIRRHHLMRRRAHARRILKDVWREQDRGIPEEWIKEWALKRANNFRQCGCWMCKDSNRDNAGTPISELKRIARVENEDA
jgi:hypothetical protein